MAANDEFPRGWTIASRGGSGGQVIIVVPAITTVAHILTDVSLSVVQGTAGLVDLVIEVLSGATGLFTLAGNNPLIEIASPANVSVQSVGSWSGKVAAKLGDTMTVRFNGAGAGQVQLLTINGYDL